jgi:PAS domain-containing protein
MQNEELRRTILELEGAHARYVELYERAPVGYVTVNPDGTIAEVNLESRQPCRERNWRWRRFEKPGDAARKAIGSTWKPRSANSTK